MTGPPGFIRILAALSFFLNLSHTLLVVKMYYKDEIMEKIREAHTKNIDDFEFTDREGEKIEVHVKRVNPDECFKDWFWL